MSCEWARAAATSLALERSGVLPAATRSVLAMQRIASSICCVVAVCVDALRFRHVVSADADAGERPIAAVASAAAERAMARVRNEGFLGMGGSLPPRGLPDRAARHRPSVTSCTLARPEGSRPSGRARARLGQRRDVLELRQADAVARRVAESR